MEYRITMEDLIAAHEAAEQAAEEITARVGIAICERLERLIQNTDPDRIESVSFGKIEFGGPIKGTIEEITPTDPPGRTVYDAEEARQDFEETVCHGVEIQRGDDGEYENPSTRMSWVDFCEGWRLRCAKYERERTFQEGRGEEPQLGYATTAQLLEELAARAEVGGYAGYRTVDE